MNPQELFCPEIECPARGQVGKGNNHVHSLQDKRCICDVCGQTFTTTKGTIFYRLRTNPVTVMIVLTLLAYGCPVQAIVKAFGFKEKASSTPPLLGVSTPPFANALHPWRGAPVI